MRNHATVLVACASLVAVLVPSRAAAAPVGVAVVGFSGGAHAELRLLASHMREQLAALADPSVMRVVPRDEMSRVYQERGAACTPADTACIVAASAQWGGRLFVRGATAPGASGVIVTAALESVRGFRVAAASAEVSSLADAAVVAPMLVRDLLAQEQAFRATLHANASAPLPAVASPAQVTEDETSDICRCFLTGPVPRMGDLVFDAERVHFRSTGGMSKEWSYPWRDIRKVETTFTSAYRPGLFLSPSSEMDFIVVYFENDYQRDRCFTSLMRARSAAE